MQTINCARRYQKMNLNNSISKTGPISKNARTTRKNLGKIWRASYSSIIRATHLNQRGESSTWGSKPRHSIPIGSKLVTLSSPSLHCDFDSFNSYCRPITWAVLALCGNHGLGTHQLFAYVCGQFVCRFSNFGYCLFGTQVLIVPIRALPLCLLSL